MELKQAGDWELTEAILYTSTGNVIPFQDSVIEIQIYESIYNRGLSGSIQLVNTIALQNEGPIIGQEYLGLVLSTPTLEDDTNKIKFDENIFHITKVIKEYNNGAEILTLDFYSSEIVHNQRKLISRTLRGTYHDIVENILRKDLKCKKRLYIEQTNDTKEYIAHNTHPMDIITGFTGQATAVRHGLPSFVFFENLRGYHFRSIQSLYAEGSRFTYFEAAESAGTGDASSPGLSNTKLNAQITQDLARLRSVNMSNNNDTMLTVATGAMSSRLITHDILQKKFTTHTYNYLDDKSVLDQGIEGYASKGKDKHLYNSTPLDDEGNRLSDFIPIQYLTPVTTIKNDSGVYKNSQYEVYNSSSGLTEYIFDPVKKENSLQKRHSIFTNFDAGISMILSCLGQTTFGAGDIITVNLKKENEHDDESTDKFSRGSFLVQDIKHVFSRESNIHTMYIKVTKDSIDHELELGDHVEIKPVKDDKTFTDKHFYGDIEGYDENGLDNVFPNDNPTSSPLRDKALADVAAKDKEKRISAGF